MDYWVTQLNELNYMSNEPKDETTEFIMKSLGIPQAEQPSSVMGSKNLSLQKEDVFLLQQLGATATATSGGRGISGLHTTVSTHIANLIKLSYCMRLNHDWARNPQLGLIPYFNERTQQTEWTGSVSHSCAVCGITMNPLSGKAIHPMELLPLNRLREYSKDMKGLGKALKEYYDRLTKSPSYKQYVKEEWGLYESLANSIEKTRGLITSMLDKQSATENEKQECKEAYDLFYNEYHSQKNKQQAK